MGGNHTDISDVLIEWGKRPMFWVVMMILVVAPLAILDQTKDWGVVEAIGNFFVQIVDVLKAAIAGAV